MRSVNDKRKRLAMIQNKCLLGALFCAVIAVSGCAVDHSAANTTRATAPRATLQAFNSEQEIRDLFKGWAEEQQRRAEADRKRRDEARAQAGSSMQYEAAPQAAPMAKAA